jgi:phosphoribosylaminoimidazolecarboxamide formyltransferase/IMP cyclohydrolase
MTRIEVRRALVSVSDKTGLDELARRLHAAGVEIVSSGGTAAAIAAAGLPVRSVAEVTGSPEILGGRVKTLHPHIHGAILADPADAGHAADLETQGIEPFQLVVVNLYPFRETVARPEVTDAEAVEMIDIGGPTMIRAAAKNHARVGVVTAPDQYAEVLTAVETGGLDDDLRVRLARKAFFLTAAYDASIVAWLERGEPLPQHLVLPLERATGLRYGENPHQAAARYADRRRRDWWESVIQHAGTPLSYLNLYDADAAWTLAGEIAAGTGKAGCVIVKHANPCGAAAADAPADAYRRAAAADPVSAFGGIVACSEPIDTATLEAMAGGPQADVIIAPGFASGIADRLSALRSATRILEAPPLDPHPLHLRQIGGGWLLQEAYRSAADPASWQVVTERTPTDAERADAVFAHRVCARVTSNAIVVVKDLAAWGIGAGQQSRVEAAEIAVRKADGRASGGAGASDAFFPFPDGLETVARSGVAVVVQPGGSVRDDEVIAKANELGLALLFTGERQFRH